MLELKIREIKGKITGFFVKLKKKFHDFRNEFGERVIRRIEKWSVIVYFVALVIFNIVYWWELINVYPGALDNGQIVNATASKLG